MSIHRLPNGTYKVRYRVGHKQFSRNGFITKREAQAWEAEQLKKIRNHSWLDPKASRAVLSDVYSEWIQNKSVADKTRLDYQEVWSNCVAPHLGFFQLAALTPQVFVSWVAELENRYSASRVRKSISIVSQILDWAIVTDRLSDNPLKRALPFLKQHRSHRPTERRETRYLTHEEVQRLAAHCSAYRDMILVMAYTGLRFGEVTALQAQDVDLLRGRIMVSRAWSDVSGKLLSVPPKSGKARTIPLPRSLRLLLEQRLESLTSLTDLVFTTQAGKPIRYSRWRRDHFDPAVQAAGLTGLRPHGLRHTYAALAVKSGANPKVLQETMGHSDIRLTLDTYGGLFGDDLDALAEGLERGIGRQDASPGVPHLFPTDATERRTS